MTEGKWKTLIPGLSESLNETGDGSVVVVKDLRTRPTDYNGFSFQSEDSGAVVAIGKNAKQALNEDKSRSFVVYLPEL